MVTGLSSQEVDDLIERKGNLVLSSRRVIQQVSEFRREAEEVGDKATGPSDLSRTLVTWFRLQGNTRPELGRR